MGLFRAPRLFEDLQGSAITQARGTGITKPDWVDTEWAYGFDDSTTEYLLCSYQLPPRYVEGTDLHVHVHWIQKATGNVLWQIEYRTSNIGEAPSATSLPVQSSTATYSWASGSLLNITDIGDISGTGLKIQAIIDIKLSRIGGDGSDTMIGDAYMKSLDLDITTDRGSQSEFKKR